jgi:hypothetical protein
MTDAQIKAATALHVTAAATGMVLILGWSVAAMTIRAWWSP